MNDPKMNDPETNDPRCCPPAKEALAIPGCEEDQNELLARLAKALGHPARVAIVRLLLQRDSCICGEIVGELSLAQSTVSQHLKVLKEAGIIRGEIARPKVCYCIEPGMISTFKALITTLL